MSDLATHELVPVQATDEQVNAFFRRHLPDFYFVNTPLSRMRRHLVLLERLPGQPLQIEFERPAGAGFTEMTLCARDHARPGLLAQVAGVLATLKINVHTAWIHTLRDPRDARSPSQVVLDTLILSEPYFGRTRVLTAKTSRSVTQALEEVLSSRGADVWPSRPQRRLAAPLVIHELSALQAGEWLMIKLRAADAEGVLFRLTHALAREQLSVEHAQINTFERAIDDVFFVSKADATALAPEDVPELLARLRWILENELVS